MTRIGSTMLRAAVRQAQGRRMYATGYEERTQKTMKTGSRLTWITTAGAAAAAIGYYTLSPPASVPSSTSTSSSSSAPSTPASQATDSSEPGHRRAATYEDDVPKPVEGRHGDSVAKHSMAAHKNQKKVREGVFSGEEFDNHLQKHSVDPSRDFEKKK